jgi:hypothetical protein
MNRLITLSRYWFLFVAAIVAGSLFSACGSDSPSGPPAPTGSSTITVMHANPDITSALQFKRDTLTLASLTYGQTGSATIPNGNSTISMRSASGTQLTSANISLDTTVSVWAILVGTLSQPEAFTVSSKKITVGATNVGVRVVNASKTVGDVKVKLNGAAGTSLTSTNLSYKGATNYVEIPVSTTASLVVTKPDDSVILTVTTGPGTFVAGKNYTVVIYGSTDPAADPSVRITSKIVAD